MRKNDLETMEHVPSSAPVTAPDDVVQRTFSTEAKLLGNILGDAIRRLAGEEAFQQEEEIRAAAKELRAQPSLDEARRLRDRLGQLNVPMLRKLIRSFSVYFD